LSLDFFGDSNFAINNFCAVCAVILFDLVVVFPGFTDYKTIPWGNFQNAARILLFCEFGGKSAGNLCGRKRKARPGFQPIGAKISAKQAKLSPFGRF
jgi:hypothetical protein